MPYYAIHHNKNDHKLTPDQQKLKQAFLETGDEWSGTWYSILQLDPHYFAAYVRLRAVPVIKQHLSRKVQELILLALDASVTHLNEHGIKVHTANALKEGASKAEILEVLELTSVLGIHAMNVGVPLLQEVLAEAGDTSMVSTAETQLTAQQAELKKEFERQRGYWNTSWDPVLRLSPDFFAAYTQFSSVPFQPEHSALSPVQKELIFIAIDVACTHLYQVGLKLHIKNAVKLGATKEMVMEVFQLASLMGVQTVMRGTDVLTEELIR